MDLVETVVGIIVVALAIAAAVSLATAVAYLSGRIAFRNHTHSPQQEPSRRGRAAGG